MVVAVAVAVAVAGAVVNPIHPQLIKFAVEKGRRSKTLIGSAIVAMAAAIVTITTVIMAAVVEPQQSWS